MYVFVLRDARSPANDAVTYAILHNKHKITYIHAYIQMRVCVCVCFRCVNAAIAVAASIFLALPLAHILYFGANSIMRRTMLIVEL